MAPSAATRTRLVGWPLRRMQKLNRTRPLLVVEQIGGWEYRIVQELIKRAFVIPRFNFLLRGMRILR